MTTQERRNKLSYWHNYIRQCHQILAVRPDDAGIKAKLANAEKQQLKVKYSV